MTDEDECEREHKRVIRKRLPHGLYEQVVAKAALDGAWRGFIVYSRQGVLVRWPEEIGHRLGPAREFAYRLWRRDEVEEVYLVSTMSSPRRPQVEVLLEGYERPAIAERFDGRLRPSTLAT